MVLANKGGGVSQRGVMLVKRGVLLVSPFIMTKVGQPRDKPFEI